MKPEEVKTECYFLPAALIYEKTGSINNSGRWIQWREKSVEPPGEAKPDFDQLLLLWRKFVRFMKRKAAPAPIRFSRPTWITRSTANQTSVRCAGR